MPLSRREISRRSVARRKAAGVCLNCTNKTDGRVVCSACAAKNKTRDQERAAGHNPVPLNKPSDLLSAEQILDAVTRFKAGETLESVAPIFGVKRATLANTFRSRGVQAGRSAGRVSLVVDRHCFDHPEIDERAAYFIGLLMADGSVSDRGLVSIGLKATDRTVVDQLNSFLGGRYRVVVHHPKSDSGRYSLNPIVRLSFQCPEITTALARFGVVQRKTKGAKFSDDCAVNKHVWRGIVDGDGSLQIKESTGYPHLDLVGTPEICLQFKTFILSHCPTWKGGVVEINSQFIKRVAVDGEHAKTMARVLYGAATLALPRKATLAARMTTWQSQRPRKK